MNRVNDTIYKVVGLLGKMFH